MGLFILQETSAGYGVFKASDKKLLEADNLVDRLKTAAKISQEIKFKEFAKFDSAAAALEEISAIVEGRVTPKLAGLLDMFKDEKKVTLAVAETKLGNAVTKLPGLNIKPVADSATTDLFRAIRKHLSELVPGMEEDNFTEMSLGLAHSMSRHKVKFSPEKVDVMIVHAIAQLDDLDKELNLFAMRVKEWYGWHFPELAKILPDNKAYAQVVLSLGSRSNAADAKFDHLPDDIAAAVKSAADMSMGAEAPREDMENIQGLAQSVLDHTEARDDLSEYLTERMKTIAPNLTELVGPLVGARLIAHAKSLVNLAKNPGSTIQILGAEKALFRALKTKHNTPKYGLIYHASLVGQASGPNKGKMARKLAAKIALGVRTDALSEWDDDVEQDEKARLGFLSRLRLERSLQKMEGKPIGRGVAVGPNGDAVAAPTKWDLKEARKYNRDADGVAGDLSSAPKRPLIEEVADEDMADADQDDENDEDEDADMENGITEVPRSPTLASVSEDSEDEPEQPGEQWQSEIQGATREAKKARKKERHARNEALADERAAKRAARKEKEKRRAEREERRVAKQEQIERRAARGEAATTSTKPAKAEPKAKESAAPKKVTEADYERLAELAGMSVSKFARRYERGQIKVNEDGTVEVLSKKELKALGKDDDEEEAPVKTKSSKRKHTADDDEAGAPSKEEKPKKKKKKHHKEIEA